jgi:hypothetical protein
MLPDSPPKETDEYNMPAVLGPPPAWTNFMSGILDDSGQRVLRTTSQFMVVSIE